MRVLVVSKSLCVYVLNQVHIYIYIYIYIYVGISVLFNFVLMLFCNVVKKNFFNFKKHSLHMQRTPDDGL